MRKKTELAERKDNRFDIAQVFFEIAIVVCSVSALTDKKYLLYFGIFMTIIGSIFTIAGYTLFF